MIEKLSNDDQYAYGQFVARGFSDKLTKLSQEDDPTDEGDVAKSKKKCPNSDCSEWNKVIETSSDTCDKCGTKLVSAE